MKTLKELYKACEEIIYEQNIHGITKEKVGGLFRDIVDKLGEHIKGVPEGGWIKTDLSEDVQTSLDKADNSLPNDTKIPSKTSDLANDSHYITSEALNIYETSEHAKDTYQQKGNYALSFLHSASYENVINTTATNSELTAKEYFIKIKKENFYKPMIVRFRIYVTPYDASAATASKNYNSFHEAVISLGSTGSISSSIYNSLLSTSYIPLRYISAFQPKTEAEWTENPYVYFGAAIRGGGTPTTVTCARNIKIELLSVEGGSDAEFIDLTSLNDLGYEAVPATYYRCDYGTNANGLIHTGDANTTYDLTLNYNSGAYYVGTEPIYRYMLIGRDRENHLIPINTTNNNTAAVKIPSKQGFDAEKNLWVYSTTTTLNANALVATDKVFSTNIRTTALNYQLQWSGNITTYPSIYIKFLKGEDGLLYLPQPTEEVPYPIYHSEELPTEDDGFYYWYIGKMYNATTGLFLDDKQVIYKYNSSLGRAVSVDRSTLDFVPTHEDILAAVRQILATS